MGAERPPLPPVLKLVGDPTERGAKLQRQLARLRSLCEEEGEPFPEEAAEYLEAFLEAHQALPCPRLSCTESGLVGQWATLGAGGRKGVVSVHFIPPFDVFYTRRYAYCSLGDLETLFPDAHHSS